MLLGRIFLGKAGLPSSRILKEKHARVMTREDNMKKMKGGGG